MPVVAVLPISLVVLMGLLSGGSSGTSAVAAVLAMLPVVITGVAASAVWRSVRLGVGLLGAFLTGGVVVVVVLGLDAVVLLLPHLLISFGCWAVALGLLVPEVCRGPAPD